MDSPTSAAHVVEVQFRGSSKWQNREFCVLERKGMIGSVVHTRSVHVRGVAVDEETPAVVVEP